MKGKTDVATLLTTSEAAECVGVTVGRILQMVRADEIPGVIRKGPRCILIPQKSAEKIRDTKPETGRPRTAESSKTAENSAKKRS